MASSEGESRACLPLPLSSFLPGTSPLSRSVSISLSAFLSFPVGGARVGPVSRGPQTRAAGVSKRVCLYISQRSLSHDLTSSCQGTCRGVPSGNAPGLAARRELPSAPRESQGREALARDGWDTDTRLGVATTLARAFAAMCVQLVDASYNLAIHMLTRGWLRSSSTHEPSDPPLEVVYVFGFAGAACLFVRRARPTKAPS